MNRNSFFFVLLFTLHIVCTDVIAGSSCSSESKSTIVKLKRHLLCEYDPDVRPVQNNNAKTRVSLYLKPRFFEYTYGTEVFVLHAWLSMTWNDSHLTWDPAQYDNIKWIPVTGYQIWVPDVLIHNERVGESSSDYTSSELMKSWVSKQGLVKWLFAAKYVSYCFIDTTWWPYDTLNCTIQFGSWSHSGDEIELVTIQNTTNVDSKSVEWNIEKIYVTRWENKYKYNSSSVVKMLSYHFILKHHWSILRIACLSPTLVLMVMTLMTLWLDPKSTERMVIANISFICHLLCIHNLHWEMPTSGFNTPKILIFYESSLGLAAFTLILTSILRHLQELTTEPPMWISASTTFILRSRIGRILLVSILDPAATAKIEADVDDNTDLVQSNSKKSPWRYIIVLIGWLAFLSVLLAYIVLLSTCFPTY